MFIINYRVLYFVVSLCIGQFSYCQIQNERLKIGVSYGIGSQSKFPFNSKDYTHEVKFHKACFNYRFSEKKHWVFEFSAEPSYNIVEHQLLNKWFIKPTDGDDYLERRDTHTNKRTINEYVLNLGIIARYKLLNNFNTYIMGSVGPMIADNATERLHEGFAFSDVIGVGLSYDLNSTRLDFRYSLRHTSNFEMKQPNNGHNTTNIEFALLFNL